MIHVFKSYITSVPGEKPRLFGSVLYDEFGNDDIKLNMFSARFVQDEEIDDGRTSQKRSMDFSEAAISEGTEELDDDERHEDLNPGKEFYYQEPVSQNWIVDYPLMAYKTFNPKNKEIAIVHLAYSMPQRVIHLGEWEFICFVNHTQMVE